MLAQSSFRRKKWLLEVITEVLRDWPCLEKYR